MGNVIFTTILWCRTPHINRLPLEKKELIIEKLVEFGVDGIETIYPTYTENDVFYAKKLCEKYNLLESGGSDYHSQSTKENQLGFNPIPDIILKKMQEKREKLDWIFKFFKQDIPFDFYLLNLVNSY